MCAPLINQRVFHVGLAVSPEFRRKKGHRTRARAT